VTTGIGNCMNDDLFMATSADGVHWQSFQALVINHLDKRFKFTAASQLIPSSQLVRKPDVGVRQVIMEDRP
jgi:hypothetical protein